jgi:hypothetical protein
VALSTPLIGFLATASAFGIRPRPDRRIFQMVFHLDDVAARGMLGALFLIMLVHAVETAKFLKAWTSYKAAVHSLAMSALSDPGLGDARFVSSTRIRPDLNPVSWSSTTPFLSVLLATNFTPARLVIDPSASYFWLSCRTATDNLAARRAVPAIGRRLIQIYSCEHRKPT